jgi:hypothetical protein
MLSFECPGVYVVRAHSADQFAQSTVEAWLNTNGLSPYTSCLWLTARPQNDIQTSLRFYLDQKNAPHLKGLNVVSIRPLFTHGGGPEGIRQLCRALNSMIVLKPALVVIEHADLWFDQGNEPLEHSHPFADMALLQRWAKHANAHIVLPCSENLAPWSVFASGLTSLNESGHMEFSPWWRKARGFVSQLWNHTPATQHGLLLHAKQFASPKHLAIRVHRLRNTHPSDYDIQVRTQGEIHEHDAPALLRLGADAVHLEDPRQPHIQTQTPHRELTSEAPLEHFAQDLHEALMPGQLTLHGNVQFATYCTMMRQLGEHWGMHSSLTRLSLLPHISPIVAVRLINFGISAGLFTLHNDSLYAFKWWATPPSDEQVLKWLKSSFHDALSSAFAGDIHILNTEGQDTMLSTLYNNPTLLPLDTLRNQGFEAPAPLSDLWTELSTHTTAPRPWTKRLNTWLSQEGIEHV